MSPEQAGPDDVSRAEQPAVRFQGATTTWSQLADRIRRLADALARRGIGPGDRVAVMTGNRPEFGPGRLLDLIEAEG